MNIASGVISVASTFSPVIAGIAGAVTAYKIAVAAAFAPLTTATIAQIAATQALNVVTGVFGAIMTFVTSPIGLVVIAIGAVIAVGVLLFKHWDKVKEAAKNLWNGIKNVFNGIKDTVSNAWGKVKETAINVWDGIKNTVFAQEESLSVSENCKWRIRHNYEEGIPNGFTVYGYNVKKRNLTINEEQAAVVREIFDMYLNGKGSKVIARTLNERAIPAPGGETWHQARIMQILRNEKYIGDLNLQKYYSENHITKRTLVNDGCLKRYYVTENHECCS